MAQEPAHRPPEEPGRDVRPAFPLWSVIGSGALLALTALAAPFYTEVMGGLIWAGQTVRALCGW